MRAALSTLPPAGYGTTRRTAREGHCGAASGLTIGIVSNPATTIDGIAKNLILPS
jgi:hypothetical protein